MKSSKRLFLGDTVDRKPNEELKKTTKNYKNPNPNEEQSIAFSDCLVRMCVCVCVCVGNCLSNIGVFDIASSFLFKCSRSFRMCLAINGFWHSVHNRMYCIHSVCVQCVCVWCEFEPEKYLCNLHSSYNPYKKIDYLFNIHAHTHTHTRT